MSNKKLWFYYHFIYSLSQYWDIFEILFSMLSKLAFHIKNCYVLKKWKKSCWTILCQACNICQEKKYRIWTVPFFQNKKKNYESFFITKKCIKRINFFKKKKNKKLVINVGWDSLIFAKISHIDEFQFNLI